MSARKFKLSFMVVAAGLFVAGVAVILLLPMTKERRALAFFVLFPLGIVGWVVDVIRDGEFGPLHGTGCRFSRAETPVRFWGVMLFSLCVALAIWALVATRLAQ